MTEPEIELEALRKKLQATEDDLEVARMKLAAVGVAIFDSRPGQGIGSDHPFYSAAYADALALNRAYHRVLEALKATGYLMPKDPDQTQPECRVPGSFHFGPLLQFNVEIGRHCFWLPQAAGSEEYSTWVRGLSCSAPGHREYVEAAYRAGKDDLEMKP